ncbi:transcriptional regulator [Veronia nyctiphanis]|uniref:Transcriptional regulator n=1 Tax=Veronia nyctiphanis TaxID=1278244 RepID=A0A4Q0YIU3_9GAMM|nr:metalloregulator ArsR/SmtB family transcription factor [Veronia nyctiphanis]RXJ70620.1 transcriptional regulator [Veronia nyctiphanis]
MSPVSFFKCLADETRLLCLLLIKSQDELCVCELIEGLTLSQPKISRHLAQLRQCGLLLDRRQGQWVFYRINPELPDWCLSVLDKTFTDNRELIDAPMARLDAMCSRPESKPCC